MMLHTLDEIPDYSGKRVLVRVEYNVDFHKGKIVDATRIDASLETIHFLIGKGAKVILMAHNGRPGGEYKEENSLKPIMKYLSDKLNVNVVFSPDCVGDDAERAIEGIDNGEVVLLENLRFNSGEKAKDDSFIAELGELADIYVNDSFGTCHNDESSNVGVPALFKKEGKPVAAGRLIEHEVRMLSQLLDPSGKGVAVIGGAKVKKKIKVVEQLARRYKVLIGGAMANTFLKAAGNHIGESIVEEDYIDEVNSVMGHFNIGLPKDIVVAHVVNKGNMKSGGMKKDDYKDVRVVDVSEDSVKEHETILDIGPATVAEYGREIKTADVLVWNGPMGYFEVKEFSSGTYKIADLIAANEDAFKVAGGGESLIAVNKSGLGDKINLSTGGGAMLAFIQKEGKIPGLLALVK